MNAPTKPHKAAGKPLIALTGATGFIGKHLLKELPKRGYRVRVLLRRPTALPEGCPSAVIGDLARPYNMAEALAGVDAIIHTAGLAGTMSGVPEDDYRVFNTEATVGFARAAAKARVKRFVFLSSIRAQCGATADGVLTEEREPKPTDAYGRSKLAAEQGLAALDMDWAALRMVLVYGPGVKGNMAQLIGLARKPYPLPLGSLAGRRSLISLDSLADAIVSVLTTSQPLRRALIAAEPEPLTVPQMIAAMRAGLGRGPGLVPMPQALLGAAARALGKSELFDRLSGSLVADPSALMQLGWTPRVSPREGLATLMKASS